MYQPPKKIWIQCEVLSTILTKLSPLQSLKQAFPTTYLSKKLWTTVAGSVTISLKFVSVVLLAVTHAGQLDYHWKFSSTSSHCSIPHLVWTATIYLSKIFMGVPQVRNIDYLSTQGDQKSCPILCQRLACQKYRHGVTLQGLQDVETAIYSQKKRKAADRRLPTLKLDDMAFSRCASLQDIDLPYPLNEVYI